MSLRAELVGSDAMPGFAVLLPDGWESNDAAFSDADERLRARIDALPYESRAAARATMAQLFQTARSEAARAEVIRVFTPVAGADGDILPVSLTASWLTAPVGSTAADLGASLVQRFGAAPLDPGGTILRWARDEQVDVEGGTVEVSGHGYLMQVPGRSTRALVFRSSILRGAEGATIPPEGVAAMTSLCDAIVASVRWRRDG